MSTFNHSPGTHDDGELHLPVGLRRVAREDQVVIGSRAGRGGLEEEDGLFRQVDPALAGVVGVVEANADDLARAGDGGAQPLGVRNAWGGRKMVARPELEPGQPLGAQEGLVPILAERGDVHANAVLRQDARLLGSRGAESDQLHQAFPPCA